MKSRLLTLHRRGGKSCETVLQRENFNGGDVFVASRCDPFDGIGGYLEQAEDMANCGYGSGCGARS